VDGAQGRRYTVCRNGGRELWTLRAARCLPAIKSEAYGAVSS
jgi:hypothetical protein